MGACVTTQSEQKVSKECIPIEPAPTDPKPVIDYYSKNPWSKNVMGIISYWNRTSNSHSIELNQDVESMIQRFSLNDLILKEWSFVTFKSNHLYEFSNIIIKKRAILSVESYDIDNNPNGGKLLLRSYGDFIVEEGGVIHCNGKGYSGGDRWFTGLSYDGETKYKEQEANYGGGGCTKLYSVLWCLSSGGGGYATKGEDGICETYNGKKYHFEGIGGGTYGDEELKVLHLGSGGGGSRFCKGGNGGGVLKIICNRFVNKGTIECNGVKGGGATKNGGGGSGGSCLIIVHGQQFDNEHGLINCIGAESIHHFGKGGAGGDGRICIKFVRNQQVDLGDFVRKSAERIFDSDGGIINKENNDEIGFVKREFGDIEPTAHIMLLDEGFSVKMDNYNETDTGNEEEFLYKRSKSILDDLVLDNVKSLDEIDIDELPTREPGSEQILDYRQEEKKEDDIDDDIMSEPGMDEGFGDEGEIKYINIYKWLNDIGLNMDVVNGYYTLFIKNGFDNFLAIQHLTDTDLEGIGIHLQNDRNIIMIAIENLSD